MMNHRATRGFAPYRILLTVGLLLVVALAAGCTFEEERWAGPGSARAVLDDTKVVVHRLLPAEVLSSPSYVGKSNWLALLGRYAVFTVSVNNGGKEGREMVELAAARLHWGTFNFPPVQARFVKESFGLDILANPGEIIAPGQTVTGILVFPPIPEELGSYQVSYPVGQLGRDITFTIGPDRDTRGN